MGMDDAVVSGLLDDLPLMPTLPLAAEGIDWSQLQWSWPLPRGVVLGLVAVVVVVATLAYLARGRLRWPQRCALAGLRLLTLLGILLMFSGVSVARFFSQPAELVVLVDDSASMALPADPAASEGPSRMQAVRSLLAGDAAWRARLEARYDVRLETLTERFEQWEAWEQASSPAEHPQSPLGTWLLEAAFTQQGKQTAAVVVFSDGRVTRGQSLERVADEVRRLEIPVVAVGVGSDRPPLDVEVETVLVDDWVLVGDRVQVRTLVRLEGVDASLEGTVRLQSRGDTPNVLAEERLRVDENQQTLWVPLEFVPREEAELSLEVVVETDVTERNTDNNRAAFPLEVRNQPLRVLLVQDAPSYEFRFLKHALERAQVQSGDAIERPSEAGGPPSLIELTSVLQQGDPRYAAQDLSAAALPPVGREDLGALDVVILSDASVASLGQVFLSQLAEVVTERGVGLLLVAGPDHLPEAIVETPLEALLPVRLAGRAAAETAFRRRPVPLRLTASGQQQPSLELREGAPATWPPVTAVWPVGGLKPAAQVLLETAEADAMPVVVTQKVGAGTVRLQLTDETFRLHAFEPTGRLYQRFWLQAIRELARGKRNANRERWELQVDGRRFVEGAPVPLRARVPGDVERVRARVRGGTIDRDVELLPAGSGGYETEVTNLPPGDYRVVLTEPIRDEGVAPAARFVVEAAPSELTQPEADYAALRAVATKTGGAFFSAAEVTREELEASIRKLPPTKLEPLPDRPLWNHPLAAVLLFGSLSAEWLLRRKWGMV